MSEAVARVPAGCVLGCILRSPVVHSLHSLWTTSLDGGEGEDEQSREGLPPPRRSKLRGQPQAARQPASTAVSGTSSKSYGPVADASGGEELATGSG